MSAFFSILAILSAALLAACGGDGSTSPQPSETETIERDSSSSQKHVGSSSSNFENSEAETGKRSSSSSYRNGTAQESSSSRLVDPDGLLNPNISYGVLVDSRDNQTYRTVKIGRLTWMAQNLNYVSERSIPSDYGIGRLYQWPEALGLDSTHISESFEFDALKLIAHENHRGICPEGWHIPTVIEYVLLVKAVEAEVGKEHVGSALKSSAVGAWPEEPDEDKPTNVSGFSAAYAGWANENDRYVKYGEDTWLGGPTTETIFWATVPNGGSGGYGFHLDKTGMVSDQMSSYYRSGKASVRCVQDRDFDEGKGAGPQQGSVYDSLENTLTDLRDNRVYRTTVIGSQVWMAENLKYVTTGGYADDMEQSRCFNDDPQYCEDFGRLYRWTAAMDIPSSYAEKVFDDTLMHQGLCPQGWHVPSNTDFDTLIVNAGGFKTAALNLKSADYWFEGGKPRPGTLKYSFDALPIMTYYERQPYASEIGRLSAFWSSWNDNLNGGSLGFVYDKDGIADFRSTEKYWFIPLRCLRDERVPE